MYQFVLVFVGGGFGALLRHSLNLASARWFGAAFPYHTLLENVTGLFVMGVLVGYFAYRGETSQHVRLFLTTGVLGGYTMLSTFSLDAALFGERHAWMSGALYVLTAVAGSILGLFFGLAIVRR